MRSKCVFWMAMHLKTHWKKNEHNFTGWNLGTGFAGCWRSWLNIQSRLWTGWGWFITVKVSTFNEGCALAALSVHAPCSLLRVCTSFDMEMDVIEPSAILVLAKVFKRPCNQICTAINKSGRLGKRWLKRFPHGAMMQFWCIRILQ